MYIYLLQKRRQQEENALREAEIKREMEEKRRIIEEEKRQVEIKREAEHDGQQEGKYTSHVFIKWTNKAPFSYL